MKKGCLKKYKKPVFIKIQEEVETGLKIERSIILDIKTKIENLFYIKIRDRMLVNRNRNTYYYTISQDGELILYQKLRLVRASLLSLLRAKKRWNKGHRQSRDLLFYKTILKIESSWPILRAKKRCFKR